MIQFEIQQLKQNELVRNRNGKLVFAYEIPVGDAAFTCGLTSPLGKRLK